MTAPHWYVWASGGRNARVNDGAVHAGIASFRVRTLRDQTAVWVGLDYVPGWPTCPDDDSDRVAYLPGGDDVYAVLGRAAAWAADMGADTLAAYGITGGRAYLTAMRAAVEVPA